MVTPQGARVEADVCIVGAGPVGLALAEALDARGATVVLLAGTAARGFRPPDEIDDALAGAFRPDGFEPLTASRARGVGGTARIWNTVVDDTRSAKYLPLDPVDLEARADGGHGGWPFRYPELAPWIEGASRVCGIHPGVWEAARAPERTGLSGGASGAHPFEPRLYAFGPAHRFTDALPGTLARAGGVTLLSGARVTALHDATEGGRSGVEWVDEAGTRGEVRAPRVVLAAGAIENARLLLLTGAERPRPWSDHFWLGRGFMEHPIDRSLELHTRHRALCPDPGFYGPHRVDGLDAGAGWAWRMGRLGLRADWLRAEGLPNASVRFTTQEAPAVLDAPAARSWGRRLVPFSAVRRRLGDGLRGAARLRRRLEGTRYRLHLDLEQWPDPARRVVLTDETDRHGRRRVGLDWRWTAADEARRERLATALARGLETAGLGRVERRPGFAVDPNAHHHAGTTRMHTDPEGGVVDGDLRVHGTAGLFVCGASVFPTAGVANPTLTAVALALRLAHHLHPAPDDPRR